MTKLRERIIKYLSQNQNGQKSYGQLLSALSKQLGEKSLDVINCTEQMIKEGILVEDNNKKLKISENLGYKKGVISGNRKGFAFIKPLNENGRISKTATHLFVSPQDLAGAFDGDEVLYKEVSDNYSNSKRNMNIQSKSERAEVIQILKRKNLSVVGDVVLGKDIKQYPDPFKLIKDNALYIIADNDKFSKPILLPSKKINSAKVGDKAEVQLTYQPEGKNFKELPTGFITRVLEKNSDIENGIITILCENDIAEGFPQEVIDAANKLETNYEKEKDNRVDLTDEMIMTIDGADAKDFDDAISISRNSEGYLLGVHIADVGEYVTRDSVLDEEAFERATSVYIPGRVYPMLPEKISNELCSLRPNEEKLALSVEMELDINGKLKDYRIFESVIKSKARLTYDQVFDVIKDSNDLTPSRLTEDFPKIIDKEIREKLFLMSDLSKKINKRRDIEGKLDFAIPETQFDMDGDIVLDVRARENNEAHQLIENFMILCNEVVAEHFCTLDAPFVYRVHEAPKNINEAIDTLNGMGFAFNELQKPTSKQVQNILKTLKKKESDKVGDKIILRSMDKARYQEDCLGHFGLALKYYCHFTSPIRRYPDLTIHRIIKKACEASPHKTIKAIDINNPAMKKLFSNNRALEAFVHLAALQSSDRELKADEAERAADDLFKAKFMEDKIGHEFKGIISGVTEFGLFVELPNTVEGMIKVENLPGGNYKYNASRMTLSTASRRFTIGDEINIKISNVKLASREIEFALNLEKTLRTDLNTKVIEDEKKQEISKKNIRTLNFCPEY